MIRHFSELQNISRAESAFPPRGLLGGVDVPRHLKNMPPGTPRVHDHEQGQRPAAFVEIRSPPPDDVFAGVAPG
ncbi:hypothetical protein DFAR_3690063 [Desulfarculales bacterium]